MALLKLDWRLFLTGTGNTGSGVAVIYMLLVVDGAAQTGLAALLDRNWEHGEWCRCHLYVIGGGWRCSNWTGGSS